ncbi:MAG: thymidine phosphorylase [Steroidobacteraceae bacterium]
MPQEAIRTKRNGGRLSRQDLVALARGLADGTLSDAQAGALAMAIYFKGMQADECSELTLAMRDSGQVFDWKGEGFNGPVLDKHSTGGVGDLVSLVLGPMLAACGAFVPLIVGRGLAHTGGTLDKLDSIPGYQSRTSPDRIRRAMREAGVAMIGAGDEIAPADRRLYAIRDVTATVDCIPLIVASILSKKLAAGADALVLDVKYGSGAVLTDPVRGRELARHIIETAAAAGLPVVALLTDMSEPLARSAGNALEIREAIAMLRGESPDPRLLEVTLALGAELMLLAGLAANAGAAREALQKALAGGAAVERFARMVASLGGPADLIERPDAYLATAPVVVEARAARDGFIAAIDTRAIGLTVVVLGGGRTRPDHAIDPAVGLDRLAPRGARVRCGGLLARGHAAPREAAEGAVEAVQGADSIGDIAPPIPLLVERVQ